MGNFMGHVFPGSLFIIFSIIWTINLMRFYFRTSKRKHGLSAEDPIFEQKSFNKPLESIILVILLPIGIFAEYVTGFEDGSVICADNIQHMTMYLFFLILSVVNLMEIYSVSSLPTLIDPLYGFAFGVETLLLYFHTHGQGAVEQHLHKLLTFSAFMCSMTSFMAGIFKKDITVQLAKPLFVLLQGIWFIQIAFLLYPPFTIHHPVKHEHHHHEMNSGLIESHNKTAINSIEHLNSSSAMHSMNPHVHADENVHRSIMITTAYFCWHFAFCIITQLTLAHICRKKYSNQEAFNEKYQRLLEETSN